MKLEALDSIYISFFVAGMLCVFLGMFLKRRAKDDIQYEESIAGINDRIHGTTSLGVGLCIILIVGVYTAYRKGVIECVK